MISKTIGFFGVLTYFQTNPCDFSDVARSGPVKRHPKTAQPQVLCPAGQYDLESEGHQHCTRKHQ